MRGATSSGGCLPTIGGCSNIPRPRQAELERYLSDLRGQEVHVTSIEDIGGPAGGKSYGYGALYRVELEGEADGLVVHATGTRGFGHELLADHAFDALLAFETYGRLPLHVQAIDVGAIHADGHLSTLADARDFFLITEFAHGAPYFRELEFAAVRDHPLPVEIDHVDQLASYLAKIHDDRRTAPELYRRRLRDLFGGDECLAGLIDSFEGLPSGGFVGPRRLQAIERRLVDWHQRMRRFVDRLCPVHGDFHPWNILFQDDEPVLLDRSRGEWGEAADDVAALAINFIGFALPIRGRFEGAMEALWMRFFDHYLEESGDRDLGKLIQPYFVWRAMVLASPVWYPDLSNDVRRILFRFIGRILEVDRFDHREVGALLAGPE